MYSLKNHFILTGILCSIFLFACNKDDMENPDAGFSDAIRNFVPDSTIQQLRDMGMAVNEGKVPPNLEGIYLASPIIMIKSSVPGEKDDSGDRYGNQLTRFRGQDNENLTVVIDFQEFSGNRIVTESYGQGGFISGNGEVFTTFTLQNGYQHINSNDSSQVQYLQVISGQMSDEGIKNYQIALLLLNDFGDPHNTLIPVNTGRLFHDTDGLAENSTMNAPLPDNEGRKKPLDLRQMLQQE